MIGYVTLGTTDLERAAKFYDELLAVIGAKRFMEDERFIAWSVSPDKPALFIMKPFNGEVATVGNGVMVALAVETPKQVDTLYAKAIALGATDEGSSGPRQMGFYAGFFRDLDGNKLNCFCMQ